jgi:hypothetical protein
VDSGTSGIAIPSNYFDEIVQLATLGLNCKGIQCAGVSAANFPTLFISLAPDNIFPLRPYDYVECTGKLVVSID